MIFMRRGFKVLRRIIIPLVKPGIIAGSILVFIPSLGAYVTPRVLGGGKNMMLGNLIELQFGQGRDWPLGAALSITLMVIVTLALLVYVRNASKGARQPWLRAFPSVIASRALRSWRCCAFCLLYRRLPLLVFYAFNAGDFGGGVGRVFAALVPRRPWNNREIKEATLRSVFIAVTSRHSCRPLPRPWQRLPRRGHTDFAASRSIYRVHQPAPDGSGNRHGCCAADRILRVIKV